MDFFLLSRPDKSLCYCVPVSRSTKKPLLAFLCLKIEKNFRIFGDYFLGLLLLLTPHSNDGYSYTKKL